MSFSTPNPPVKKGSRFRPAAGQQRSRMETARTGGMIVLAVLLTLFAVFNLKEVEVNWIFGSGRAPLIIVILVSVIVGIVLTYGAERINRKRRAGKP
jgi:uncharacterized integral membrane protein